MRSAGSDLCCASRSGGRRRRSRLDSLTMRAFNPLLAVHLLLLTACASLTSASFMNSDDATAQQHVFGEPTSDSASSSSSHRRRPGQIFLIRHAEKVRHGGKGLAERGKERAQCLKHVFGHGENKVGYIIAQAYKPDGKRSRPYETVKPLADYLGLDVDLHCEREDGDCVAKRAIHEVQKGHNVLICWQHRALTGVARSLGIHGLRYPAARSDILFQISHRGEVHAIRSEECAGLDDRYRGWHGSKAMRPDEKLVDDEAWAPGAGEHVYGVELAEISVLAEGTDSDNDA